jgi:hypothetical protein
MILFAGCSSSGGIGVSYPRIWRQETLRQDAINRISELQGSRQELSEALKKLAGWRLRKEVIETQLKATRRKEKEASGKPKKVTAGDASVDTNKEPPGDTLKQLKGLFGVDINNLGQQVNEEALDLLRRQEDFGDLFTGTLLKYISDDASLRPNHELFLLGFDISVNAGGWTSSSGWLSSGYSVYVRIEVIEPKEGVRVYAVSPQQYAERFKEGLALRNDLKLALDVEKQGLGQGGKFALDRSRKSEEQLALIQRYPLISGFIDQQKNKISFGWQISPRFRIVDRPWYSGWLFGFYGTESAMEDGVRNVLAAVEVEKQPDEDKVLRLKVTTYWESAEWHQKIGEETRELRLTLPKNPRKRFIGPTPILPDSGPGEEENIVTIRGQDFGTRAEVYVGTRKACEVKVLSRTFIEARLPRCYSNQPCEKIPQQVKVLSHGDSYVRYEYEERQGNKTTKKLKEVRFKYSKPFAPRPAGGEPKPCEAGGVSAPTLAKPSVFPPLKVGERLTIFGKNLASAAKVRFVKKEGDALKVKDKNEFHSHGPRKIIVDSPPNAGNYEVYVEFDEYPPLKYGEIKIKE